MSVALEKAFAMKISARTSALKFIPLSLLLVFALACVGGNTPQVQESLNRSKTNYEDWLRTTGSLPGSVIGPPLIVVPVEDESFDAEELVVSGWSATATSKGAHEGDTARVQLFVMPADAGATRFPVRDEYLEGTATVDEQTGEWELTIAASRLYRGVNILGARTVIDGIGSSGVTRLSVLSSTGREGDPGFSAAERLDLVCVFVAWGDHRFEQGVRESFAEGIEHAAEYFRESSRGNLAIGEIEWLTSAEDPPMRLDLPSDFRTGDQVAEYFDELAAQEEIAAALEQFDARGHAYSLIVMVPPGAEPGVGYAGWSVPWGSDVRGSLIHLRNATPGVAAHEIAHGMGRKRRVDEHPVATRDEKATAQLPDLYHTTDLDYYGVRGFSNLTQWRRASNYFLMSSGGLIRPDGFVPTLSGFSQQWLEWVEFERHAPSTEYTAVDVPNLSAYDARVTRVPVVMSPDSDHPGYVVMEARTRSGEYGGADRALSGTWWAGDGVVLYKITEWPDGQTTQDARRAARWIRSIDYIDTLDPGYPLHLEYGYGLVIRLDSTRYNPAASTQGVSVRSLRSEPYAVESIASQHIGIMLTPTDLGPEALPIAPAAQSVFSAPTGQPQPFPDLDLHVYLVDGRHIGMNYETREYENPVPSAIVSGDRSLDDEWILLPPELAEGARYEVSSFDTLDAQEFFEHLSTTELTLGFEVKPFLSDELALTYAEGSPESGELSPGESVFTVVQAQEDTLTVSPLDSDRAAFELDEEGLAANRTTFWLAIALLLFFAGLVVLLWPRRCSG